MLKVHIHFTTFLSYSCISYSQHIPQFISIGVLNCCCCGGGVLCRMYTAIIAKPCRIAEAGISKQDFIKPCIPNRLLMSVKNNHSYPFVHFLDKIQKNTLFASQTAISSVCNPQNPLSRGPVGDNKDAGEKKDDDQSSGVTQLSR